MKVLGILSLKEDQKIILNLSQDQLSGLKTMNFFVKQLFLSETFFNCIKINYFSVPIVQTRKLQLFDAQ